MTSSNPRQPEDNTSLEQGRTDGKPAAPPAPAPAPPDLIGAEVIRAKLIQHAAEGERDKAVRLQVTRAVLHALYGQGGAACHSMTGAVLKVLAEEARAAADEGVVGAEGVLLAVGDAQEAVGAAFSEWLTFCRQK